MQIKYSARCVISNKLDKRRKRKNNSDQNFLERKRDLVKNESPRHLCSGAGCLYSQGYLPEPSESVEECTSWYENLLLLPFPGG